MSEDKPDPAAPGFIDEAAINRVTDDGHRALGRYLALFSQLIYGMRWQLTLRLTTVENPPEVVELAFTGATARPIADAFFAMCRKLGNHEEEQTKTAKNLRNAVMEAIRFRNDAAHGDWYIGWIEVDAPSAPNSPTYEKIDAARKAGPKLAAEPDLDAEADKLAYLNLALQEYGRVCLGAYDPLKKQGGEIADLVPDSVAEAVAVEGKKLVPGPKRKGAFPPIDVG